MYKKAFTSFYCLSHLPQRSYLKKGKIVMKKITVALIFVTLTTFGFQAQATNHEVEPNNSLTTAVPIDSGQSTKGNISSENDFDTFKIVATQKGSVRILFQKTPTNYTTNLALIRVMDKNGTEIGSADVPGNKAYTSLDLPAVVGDVFYIEISGCNTDYSSCEYYQTKPYTLLVTNLPAPTFESEPNDLITTADILAPSAIIHAQHSTENDDDFFKILLPSAGDFTVRVSQPVDNSYWLYVLSDISVLDASGNILGFDKVLAGEMDAEVVIGVKASQVIYIKTRSCDTDESNACKDNYRSSYQISTSFHAGVTLSVTDASISEGNSGSKKLNFKVSLSQPVNYPVKYNITTADGSAKAGSDYVNNILVNEIIPAGAINKTFSVVINGDATPELNEKFLVKVSKVTGASVIRSQATGTIVNDD